MLKSSAAFSRRGRAGAGQEVLSAGEPAVYRSRVAELAPPGLLAWRHAPSATGP